MKKILSLLLTALVLLTIAVSCAQDVTVDAQLYNKVDTEVFMLNGKYYATLQEAVNARLGKGAKAAGDNDGVIYLRKNAAGPGAVINDPNTPVTIDFAGYTYSFKDVTATEGSTTGSFGLSISGGSEVTLKGTSTMTLFDSTANLTMVYVEGATTTLTIEGAPKMKVEPAQYLFWAANGATLTIGGETTMTGGLAATGTEEKVPRVVISTTEESSISTLKIAAATVEPTGGNVEVASLKASDNAIISASGEAGITITSDDSGDSSYSIQNTGGGTVKNEDATIGHGQAQKTTDGTKTTGDASVARIGTQNYFTIVDAIGAGDGKTIVLLADITGFQIVTGSRTITADLNGKNVGAATGGEIVFNTTGGLLIVQNTSQAIGSVFIKIPGSNIPDNSLVIYGGKYNLDVSDYVAEGYVARKTGDVWTVSKADEEVEVDGVKMSLVDFAKSVNSGESYEGETVTLLKDVDLSGITWIPIGNGARSKTGSGNTEVDSYTGNAFKGTFNGNGKTIKNLSNVGYSPAYKKGNEYTYGLFGVVEGATISDLILSDVSILAPKEATLEGDSVGAIVGYSLGSLELTKCTVSGSVEAYAAVGGVAGRVYGLPNAVITISDCTNNSTVTGSEHVAGVVGWLDGSPRGGSGSSTISVIDCVNNGDITDNGSTTGVAGVFCFGHEPREWSLTATRNANHGTLTQTTGGEFGYVAVCDSGYDSSRSTYLTYSFANNTNDGTIDIGSRPERSKYIICAMGYAGNLQWDYSGANYKEYDGESHNPQ